MRGLRARGGLVVDLSWADGELTGARIIASDARTVLIRRGELTGALDVC